MLGLQTEPRPSGSVTERAVITPSRSRLGLYENDEL